MISPRKRSILAKRRSLAKRRLLVSSRINIIPKRPILSSKRSKSDAYYKNLAEDFVEEQMQYGDAWDSEWTEWCFEGSYPRFLEEFLEYNSRHGEEVYDENDWRPGNVSETKREHFFYDYEEWCREGDVWFEFIKSMEEDILFDIKRLIEDENPRTFSGYEKDIKEFLKDKGIRISSERKPAIYSRSKR